MKDLNRKMAYLQEKTKLRNIILESMDGTNTGCLEDYYINMKDGSWGLYGGDIMDNNGNIYSNGLDNELLHFRTTSIGELVDEHRELYLTKNEYITKVFDELDSKIESYQIKNIDKEMDYLSFNMKINAAGNVSIETYDDFGKTYKETGFGYDKTSFALTQLVGDRLNISQEQKSMVQSGSFVSGIENLSENLGGRFLMEEIDKNHYFCKLKLPKENFYSDECMEQKRLVESTNSVKVILNSLNSEFDVVKKIANFQMNEMFEQDPKKILNFISNSEDSIKKEIVSNPYAKKEILDSLSKDENEDIRKKIAIHPRVSVDTLNVLSNDFNNYVRAYVASNPNTPINILENLSNKGELEVVREEVAKNKSTPISILDKFLNDKSETFSVKFLSLLNVASNPNTPKEILKNLEKHIDMEAVALGFLSNKNTSIELLEKISNIKYDSPFVKEELLKNPKLTIEILEKISQDDNSFLRYMVVSNPLVTKEILDKLSQDDDLQVSSMALEKLNSSNNDLDMLDFADKALDKSKTQEIEKSKSKQHYHNH